MLAFWFCVLLLAGAVSAVGIGCIMQGWPR